MSDSQDTEALYLLHKPKAKEAAGWASRHFWRPLDETQDHADFALALLLLERLDEHDPEKMALGPWLRTKICYHLRTVYTRGRHPLVEDIHEPTTGREVNRSDTMAKWEAGDFSNIPPAMIDRPSKIQLMLREIGEEGAALLGIIRDLPGDLWAEVCPMNGRTQSTKYNNLRAWLIDTQDWTIRRAEQAFMEVEECL